MEEERGGATPARRQGACAASRETSVHLDLVGHVDGLAGLEEVGLGDTSTVVGVHTRAHLAARSGRTGAGAPSFAAIVRVHDGAAGGGGGGEAHERSVGGHGVAHQGLGHVGVRGVLADDGVGQRLAGVGGGLVDRLGHGGLAAVVADGDGVVGVLDRHAGGGRLGFLVEGDGLLGSRAGHVDHSDQLDFFTGLDGAGVAALERGVAGVEPAVAVHVAVVHHGHDHGGGVDGAVGVEDGHRRGAADHEGVVLAAQVGDFHRQVGADGRGAGLGVAGDQGGVGVTGNASRGRADGGGVTTGGGGGVTERQTGHLDVDDIGGLVTLARVVLAGGGDNHSGLTGELGGGHASRQGHDHLNVGGLTGGHVRHFGVAVAVGIGQSVAVRVTEGDGAASREGVGLGQLEGIRAVAGVLERVGEGHGDAARGQRGHGGNLAVVGGGRDRHAFGAGVSGGHGVAVAVRVSLRPDHDAVLTVDSHGVGVVGVTRQGGIVAEVGVVVAGAGGIATELVGAGRGAGHVVDLEELDRLADGHARDGGGGARVDFGLLELTVAVGVPVEPDVLGGLDRAGGIRGVGQGVGLAVDVAGVDQRVDEGHVLVAGLDFLGLTGLGVVRLGGVRAAVVGRNGEAGNRVDHRDDGGRFNRLTGGVGVGRGGFGREGDFRLVDDLGAGGGHGGAGSGAGLSTSGTQRECSDDGEERRELAHVRLLDTER